MSKAFVVMGDPNTKKSSTIRALTGVQVKGLWQVAMGGGISKTETVQVYISSLQEAAINEAKRSSIRPNQTTYWNTNFIKQPEVMSAKTNNYSLLIPVWIHGTNNRNYHLPDGVDYIQTLHQHGWSIEGISILNQTQNSKIYKQITSLPYIHPTKVITIADTFQTKHTVSSKPANQIAASIRSTWSWL
ncbi:MULTISPECIES: hypothetical protein [Bacillaceae]|uniref:hypothetical protein n=1 Tax=Bacillaceae TaxID=186817 RepID=UPI000BFE8128|nr:MULTISPECIES: hypothetical protein [Bacillaceae]PGT89021.1 hypothetical protein COD11_04925 [Bacillus sp. AFS040349]UGB30647.1 hypothetical protein LPC09_23610 [Metabacillus sp. B2-18]